MRTTYSYRLIQKLCPGLGLVRKVYVQDIMALIPTNRHISRAIQTDVKPTEIAFRIRQEVTMYRECSSPCKPSTNNSNALGHFQTSQQCTSKLSHELKIYLPADSLSDAQLDEKSLSVLAKYFFKVWCVSSIDSCRSIGEGPLAFPMQILRNRCFLHRAADVEKFGQHEVQFITSCLWKFHHEIISICGRVGGEGLKLKHQLSLGLC